jgi:hypothetical protein
VLGDGDENGQRTRKAKDAYLARLSPVCFFPSSTTVGSEVGVNVIGGAWDMLEGA